MEELYIYIRQGVEKENLYKAFTLVYNGYVMEISEYTDKIYFFKAFSLEELMLNRFSQLNKVDLILYIDDLEKFKKTVYNFISRDEEINDENANFKQMMRIFEKRIKEIKNEL